MTLKAGYHIHITSWENDADHYNTCTIVAQSETEVAFYIEWLQLFKSRHERNGTDDTRFGNTSFANWTETIGEHLLELTNNLRREYGFEDTECVEHMHEDIAEALSSSEYFMYRVCESIRVYHIKEDIPLFIVGN